MCILESLILDDDWTTGYYTLTSGTFYTDETTKIIIETDSDYGFPAGGKSAVEWPDDFYAHKEYWMTLNIKVNGDHIEEILGIANNGIFCQAITYQIALTVEKRAYKRIAF